MVYKKEKILIIATVLCSVMVNFVFAEETPDSIMLRKKPAAVQNSVQPKAAKEQVMEVKPAAVKAPVVEDKPSKVEEKVDVSVEKVAVENSKSAEKVHKEKKEKKAPPRDAVITADRTDYDRKEGVVLFDRNVYVDDAQYQMHTDRLFLFLDGTNDLKRLVAIGNVAITNENRRAYCARATFNKKLGRIVMYSSDEITASLREEGKKGSEVKGEKITFWIDSEQVEVENPVITMPGGFGGKDSLKKAIGR
jgi:lipopolysaccharide transport protein LptA